MSNCVCTYSTSTCLHDAGYTAGSVYSSAGGAADYVCLADDPVWGEYDDMAQSHPARIYGTEYQIKQQYSDGGAAFFGQNMYEHDVPCVACHTPRHATIMIPGRNQCYPGWTMEYWGYLVSSADTFSTASNYACLDSRPEVEAGDQNNDDGRLMYVVEAVCGSLKCPPYVDNREIACVVCSK